MNHYFDYKKIVEFNKGYVVKFATIPTHQYGLIFNKFKYNETIAYIM